MPSVGIGLGSETTGGGVFFLAMQPLWRGRTIGDPGQGGGGDCPPGGGVEGGLFVGSQVAHHFTPPPLCNNFVPPSPSTPTGESTRCFQGVPLSGAAGTPCSRHHSHMGEGHMAPSPRAKPPVKPFKPSPSSPPLHTNSFENLLTRWIRMPTLSNLSRFNSRSLHVDWPWWTLTRRGPPSHILGTGKKSFVIGNFSHVRPGVDRDLSRTPAPHQRSAPRPTLSAPPPPSRPGLAC